MTRLAIIADDLTGALDTAVAFCAPQHRVVVATGLPALPRALASGADVVAVSTGCRDAAADLARDRAAQALALCADLPLFKRMDSRLRGPLMAELDALPAEAPLWVLPAIPELNRITQNGHVRGLGLATPRAIAPRLGPHATRATMPDTATPAQMDVALAAKPAGAVLVGARGAALAMARQWGLTSVAQCTPRGVLGMLVGSTDPITLTQITGLPATGLHHLRAPSGLWEGAMPADGPILVQAVPGPPCPEALCAERLASLFAHAATTRDVLMLSGGATAEAGLRAQNIDLLDLHGEILPGLPVARAGGRWIITKSGGLGLPDTLATLLRICG